MSQPNDNPDDPYVPAEALPPPPPREKPMGFFEHLEELRGVLVKSLIAFVICAVAIGYFVREFFDVLQWPLHQARTQYPEFVLDLGTHKVFEVFTMLIQMCVMGGLALASPAILFFIGQFVAPALTERETKAVLPMCISALFLFLLGASFGFFLLMPASIEAAVRLHDWFGLTARWTVGDYYSTMMWLVFGVGASFEFPLVVVMLVWLGLLSTAFLRKYRRHAIVAIFVIAAVVTPTPDPFIQTIFALPLYALYEIAIIVSSRIEKKREGKARFG